MLGDIATVIQTALLPLCSWLWFRYGKSKGLSVVSEGCAECEKVLATMHTYHNITEASK